MKKICMLLVLAMILPMALACAEGFVESPVVQAAVVTKVAASEEAAAASEKLVVDIVEEKKENEIALLENVTKAIVEKTNTETFGEEFVTAAAALIPETASVDDFELNELEVLVVDGYETSYGVVEVTFQFANEYAEDAVLLGAVGVAEGEDMAWYPVEAVVEEGCVKVTFTEEVLEIVEQNEAVLAIFEVR